MKKPTINTKPVAQQYAAPNERIIEIGNGSTSMDSHQGGLISVRTLDDGTLQVDVYRLDQGVKVSISHDDPSAAPESFDRSALAFLTPDAVTALRTLADLSRARTLRLLERGCTREETAYSDAVEDVLRYVAGDSKATGELTHIIEGR